MQKNCSSDPSNPTTTDCVCPSTSLSNQAQSNCSDPSKNSRTAQGPVSVVNSKGVVGKFCQNVLQRPPPSCATSSNASCMCPVGSTVTADSNGGYFCKNVT